MLHETILSQCGKIERVETWSLVLELYLCNELIIIDSFSENFSDETGMNNCNLKFYARWKKEN